MYESPKSCVTNIQGVKFYFKNTLISVTICFWLDSKLKLDRIHN